MRLTAIKLAGFKSFVDPTTLDINASLTGIVGPNGCGKSNVIDAVRWVTGESNARHLRGEALEDVIFNGSTGRKPVGRVSVELRFDNSEGKLGGQYARFANIAIRRELTRDGGSRYYINGAKARRRDVVDLFLGTGLGGRSNYAVIEQGSVNRLVEAKPDQIRQVLEEAAGISRYKERRRETENRIRHTRENLDRLNDLIGEVSQRLAVLKRQARNAERYKTLKQEERRLRAQLLALRWRAFDNDVQVARGKLRQRERTLAGAVSAQRQANQLREQHERARQAATDACQQQQTTFYDAQAEATRVEQALEHARRLREMRQRERDELVDRQTQLQERVTADETALTQAEQAIADTQADLATNRDVRDQAQTRLTDAEQAIEQAERQWDAHNIDEQSPVARLEAERTQRAYLTQRIKQTGQLLDKRRTETEQLERRDESADLQQLRDQLHALTTQIDADESKSRNVGEQLAVVAGQSQQLGADLEQLRKQLAEQDARLTSAKTLQRAALREDDAAIHQWLDAQGYSDAQSVARLVEAPAEWQTAVEVALAPWLAGFAVQQLPAADTQWPDSSLSLVETAGTLPAKPTATVAGLPCLAGRLVAPAAVLAAAQQIFVADNVVDALAARNQLARGEQIVTRDGICIGRRELHAPAREAASQGILEREQGIKTLTAEREGSADQLQTLEQRKADLDQQHDELQQQNRSLEQTLSAARREQAQKHAEQQGMQTRLEQRRQRSAELATDIQRLQQQYDEAQGETRALDDRLAALQTQARQYTHERDAARTALADARHTRVDARKEFEQAETRVRHAEQARATAGNSRDSLIARLEDARASHAQVTERLTVFDAATGQDQGSVAPSDVDRQAAQQRHRQAERQLREARETLRAAEQQGEQTAREVMQADQAVAEARDNMQQARIAVETAGARRDGLVEQLDELGETAPDLLKNIDADASVDGWQQHIEAVERKIARLGAINLAAIEEYDAEAERQQYLDEQHSDLSDALDTLESAIAKIDRETRNRFSDTFEQVNQRFGTMFPTLFGGGQASLELTESDLLSTGVRVMARPPGKRNASIQMLSGGEKAMTAVALLFALFELNPAPFCMLDEIDAPLDDANVERFCKLVRHMSAEVQFIVITHNKLTMELAEQLHGVTMMEPGVSRLVSVNIDEALDLAG